MRKNSARNSLFSLLSLLFPVLLGLVFIPHFIHDFGKERFSFLTLVWALFGYFSFLDLGIGRTLTKIIAQQNAQSAEPSYSFILSAQTIIASLSLAFAFVIFLLADIIVFRLLNISPELQAEFASSIRIVAWGIPFVTLMSLNRSILEGFSDFFNANILQVLVGIFLFILPYVFWKIHPSMVAICAGVLLGRGAVYVYSHFLYKKKLPLLVRRPGQLGADFKMLMSHGVWITLSNVLGPIMANFDKFLLGNITVLKAIVYYTTPMEMVSRLWAIPNGVTRIFFPQFAATDKDEHIQQHFRAATQIMGFFIFPVCLVIFVFARELLSLWISPEFADESYLLTQLMLIGLLFNCFNWIPYGWLQATKHVRWSVYTILIEVPLFLAAFYYFTDRYGLAGSAAVWSGRLIFDYFLTYLITVIFRPVLKSEWLFSLMYLMGGTILFLIINSAPNWIWKLAGTVACLILFIIINRRLIKEMIFR